MSTVTSVAYCERTAAFDDSRRDNDSELRFRLLVIVVIIRLYYFKLVFLIDKFV